MYQLPWATKASYYRHIRSVAQMLIVAYLDNTSLDEQDGTLDVLVLRTLADIKAIGGAYSLYVVIYKCCC